MTFRGGKMFGRRGERGGAGTAISAKETWI